MPERKGKVKTKSAAITRKRQPPNRTANSLPPEIQRTVEELRRRFREKFGRNPGPNDPLFFDPQASEPIPISRESLNQMWEHLAATLLEAGKITPQAAYAMKKTGLLVTDATAHLMTDTERNAWHAAKDEYTRQATSAVNGSNSDRSKLRQGR